MQLLLKYLLHRPRPMTLFYSDFTKSISQKRREQIEKRKEEIWHKMFAAPVVDKDCGPSPM